jgi:hypothetical protein
LPWQSRWSMRGGGGLMWSSMSWPRGESRARVWRDVLHCSTARCKLCSDPKYPRSRSQESRTKGMERLQKKQSRIQIYFRIPQSRMKNEKLHPYSLPYRYPYCLRLIGKFFSYS